MSRVSSCRCRDLGPRSGILKQVRAPRCMRSRGPRHVRLSCGGLPQPRGQASVLPCVRRASVALAVSRSLRRGPAPEGSVPWPADRIGGRRARAPGSSSGLRLPADPHRGASSEEVAPVVPGPERPGPSPAARSRRGRASGRSSSVRRGLPLRSAAGVSSEWPARRARRGRSSTPVSARRTRGFAEVSGRVCLPTGCAQLVLRQERVHPQVVPRSVHRASRTHLTPDSNLLSARPRCCPADCRVPRAHHPGKRRFAGREGG